MTATIPYNRGTPETITRALQLYYTRSAQTDNHATYLIWNDSWAQTFYKNVKVCELRIISQWQNFAHFKSQSEFFLP